LTFSKVKSDLKQKSISAEKIKNLKNLKTKENKMLSIAPFFTARDVWNNLPVYDEREFSPAYEFHEATDHYALSVDLPGLKKEDINIDLVENTMTVSGVRKRGGETVTYRKNFVLPPYIDSDKIEAAYEDGVLNLRLAKLAAAQPRKIQIQSGRDLSETKKPAV
jgi:HSP20 family protein